MELEQISVTGKAGKQLLKICMGDIYHNPMVVYREYVQNSCDSLQEAERNNYFQSKTQKTVSIEVKSNCITIHDRGIGVKNEDIEKTLIWLSYKNKSGQFIGRYGIGRLTGAKYCDELVFETSAKGETYKNIVRFDAKKAREILANNEEYEVQEVIEMVTTRYRGEDDENQHYFRVTMNNVFERHLLDISMATKYLSDTVPVDYSVQFKDYILNPAFSNNNEFEHLYNNLITCNVYLNGAQIRKPYDSSVNNAHNIEERLGKAKFFKIENDGEFIAWGWYAMTASAKQFIGSVPFRKIRLRQLNMAVGDETYFDNLFDNDIAASYFVGEVFAVHEAIEPTTGREGLTDNDYKKIFEYQIKTKFKSMSKEYNTLSKFGSQIIDPLAKYSRSLRIINKEIEVGVKTAEEVKNDKSDASAKLKEVKDKLTNELSKIRTAKKIDDLIDGIVEYYQELSDAETDKYNKQKDTQKSNASVNKFNIAYEIDKLMGDKERSDKSNNQEENSDSTTNDSSKKSDETTKSNSPVSSIEGTQPNETDDKQKQDELDAYKGMTALEKALIRKVYRILNGQKDLAPTIREKLKSKMVKQLTKK